MSVIQYRAPGADIHQTVGFCDDVGKLQELCGLYRGADKSLARPGREQARKHARDARDFKQNRDARRELS